MSLYLAVVAAQLALAPGPMVPMFPDEAQYSVVAENLLRSAEYSLRGDFPLLRPPLYPLMIAGVRRLPLPGDPERRLVVANVAVFAVAIFFAFGLACAVGLSRGTALWIAAAAGVVPNSILAAHYMSEPLYYPLALGALWSGARWLRAPASRRAAAVGCFLGLALLTKYVGGVLWLAWLVSLALLAWRRRATPLHGRIAAGAAWSFATASVIALPWYAYAASRIDYSFRELFISYHPGGPPVFSAALVASWIPAHVAILFLSAGIVAAVPFTRGLRAVAREEAGLATWLLTTAALSIVQTSAANAYLLGQIDDRYLFPLFVVVAAVACRGFEIPDSRPTPWLLSSALAALLLVALLGSMRFHGAPVTSLPWLYGFARWPSLELAWNPALDWPRFRVRAIGAGILLSLVWLASARWRAKIFAAALSLMWVVATGTTHAAVRAWGHSTHELELARWLDARIGSGRKIAVIGPRARFERPRKTYGPEPELEAWTRAFGIPERAILAAEARDRHDVRKVPRVELLPEIARKAGSEYLLSVVPFDHERPLGVFGFTYLYDLRGADLESWVPSSEALFFLRDRVTAPSARFRRLDAREIAGWVAEKRGALTEGPPLPLPAGRYTVYGCWRTLGEPWRATVEVRDLSRARIVARASLTSKAAAADRPLVRFASTGGSFSIRTIANEGRVLFCGALVRRDP